MKVNKEVELKKEAQEAEAEYLLAIESFEQAEPDLIEAACYRILYTQSKWMALVERHKALAQKIQRK